MECELFSSKWESEKKGKENSEGSTLLRSILLRKVFGGCREEKLNCT